MNEFGQNSLPAEQTGFDFKSYEEEKTITSALP